MLSESFENELKETLSKINSIDDVKMIYPLREIFTWELQNTDNILPKEIRRIAKNGLRHITVPSIVESITQRIVNYFMGIKYKKS